MCIRDRTLTTNDPAGVCNPVSDQVLITITHLPVATFDYTVPQTSTQYCKNFPTNPSPHFTGGGVAGTFTANSPNLVFKAGGAPGQVDLALSQPGTYTVTNTIAAANGCHVVTATADITILALPVASISYPPGAFCTSEGPKTVTLTQDGDVFSGSFTSNPAGLSISASTGTITPSTSAAGTYTVTYTFSSPSCSNTTTTTVTIVELDKVVGGATTICTGSGTNITVAASDANVTYQLRNNADNTLVGSAVTGNGSSINLPTGPLTSTTTFNVLATYTPTSCTKQLTNTPTVTVTPQPTATAGGSQAICYTGTATVSGATSSNGTILWTHNGQGTISNQTTITPTYTPAIGDTNKTVTLTLTVSNSPCIAATATYSVIVQAPTVSAGAPAADICQGGVSAPIGGAFGGTATSATWSDGGVGGTFSPDANAASNPTWTPPASYSGTATLTLTTSGGACGTVSATKTIFVDPNCHIITLTQPAQLVATIAQDGATTICNGQSTTISVTISGGTPPYVLNGVQHADPGTYCLLYTSDAADERSSV